MKILVVEDNPINQKIALLLLKKLGYDVDIAANGIEALMAVAKTGYDLILMDIQMPEMDGFETVRLIRQRYPQQGYSKIVAVTADGERRLCLEAGMNDHIRKPLTIEALKKVLPTHF